MNWIVTILKLGKLIGTLILPTIEDAMRVKRLFNLTPDFEVNVKMLSDEALDANQDTRTLISDWAKRHNLPEEKEENK